MSELARLKYAAGTYDIPVLDEGGNLLRTMTVTVTDPFDLVVTLDPSFSDDPKIGSEINDVVEGGFYTTPPASIVFNYQVNGVPVSGEYVPDDADDGALLTGTAVVTDGDGDAKEFDLGVRKITYERPFLKTFDSLGLTTAQSANLPWSDLVTGDGSTFTIYNPRAGVTFDQVGITVDGAVSGEVSDSIFFTSTNSGGTTAGVLNFDVTDAITAPAAPVRGTDFLLTGDGSGGEALLRIVQLPSNGGAAITGAKYSVDGGALIDLPNHIPGDYLIEGLTDGVEADIALLFVNSAGDGTPSAIAPVTTSDVIAPTVAAGEPDPATGALSYTVSEAGTFHWLRNDTAAVYADGAALVAAKPAAADSGAIAAVADVTDAVTLTGLDAGVAYIHTVMEDAAGNYSVPNVQAINFEDTSVVATFTANVVRSNDAVLTWGSSELPADQQNLRMAKEIDPLTETQFILLSTGHGDRTSLLTNAGGGVTARVRDTSGTMLFEASSTAAIALPADTLSVIDWKVDVLNKVSTVWINGTAVPFDAPNTDWPTDTSGIFISEGLGSILAQNSLALDVEMSQWFLQMTDDAIPDNRFWNGDGTEFDWATVGNPQFLMGGPQVAADWNAGTNRGTGSFSNAPLSSPLYTDV